MKRCPECRRDYYDDTLLYCLDDGNALLEGPASVDEPATAILSEPPAIAGGLSQPTDEMDVKTAILQPPATAGGSDSSEKQRLSAHRAAKPLAALAIVVTILIGGFFGYRYLGSAESGQINSIAVLPFENKTSDADSEYLSDGLAESLIYRLSQLPDLKVSPTSSVFRYKGREADPQVVAKELGVDSVMTGRITTRGESLTISVNLVDTRNGKSLWGEQYERKLSELLNTQREIASEIVSKLQLKLSGVGEQKLAKKYTSNPEAYELYLRGRFHYWRRSKADLLKAIDYFQKAIKLDPNFARAYVELSFTYSSGRGNGFFSRSDALQKAREAADKSLKIDPNMVEAHSALALVLAAEWKFSEAEREHKIAIDLDPNNGDAHFQYGATLESMGRMDQALQEKKAAAELEPLSLPINANLAGAYMFVGQNDIALEQARKTYDLDPNFIAGRFWLMWVYCANKMYTETIEIYEASQKDEATQRIFAQFGGYAYAKTGRRSESEKLLRLITTDPENSHNYSAAVIYSALGENEKAVNEIEKGYLEKLTTVAGRLRVDPLLEEMRSDPKYKEMLKRLDLPE